MSRWKKSYRSCGWSDGHGRYRNHSGELDFGNRSSDNLEWRSFHRRRGGGYRRWRGRRLNFGDRDSSGGGDFDGRRLAAAASAATCAAAATTAATIASTSTSTSASAPSPIATPPKASTSAVPAAIVPSTTTAATSSSTSTPTATVIVSTPAKPTAAFVVTASAASAPAITESVPAPKLVVIIVIVASPEPSAESPSPTIVVSGISVFVVTASPVEATTKPAVPSPTFVVVLPALEGFSSEQPEHLPAQSAHLFSLCEWRHPFAPWHPRPESGEPPDVCVLCYALAGGVVDVMSEIPSAPVGVELPSRRDMWSLEIIKRRQSK